MTSFILKRTIAATVFLLASTAAFAQAGSVDFAAGGGVASYHNDGSTNKGKFDASVSFNVLSSLSVGFEYGFSPISSVNDTGYSGTVSGTDHVNSYGAVIRAGFLPDARIDPYAVFSGGGVKETATETVTGSGYSINESESNSGGYAGIGGGVNLYLTPHFGVRPEVRYQYLHLDGDHINEVDVTGSIFYTFGGHKR